MANKRAVQRGEDPLRLYLAEIGRYDLLSKDDEVCLGQSVEAGKQACAELAEAGWVDPGRARELRGLVRRGDESAAVFVRGNLRLVVSIAKRYQGSAVPLLDLVQEGNLGLMHAVEKFDWRRGFKFSTYATWWIRQAISRGISNTGRAVRLPPHAADLLAGVTRARTELERRSGHKATVGEIAVHLGVDETRVLEVIRHSGAPLSLSASLIADNDASLEDIVEDDTAVSPFDAAATALLRDDVKKMLMTLDEREQTVLRLRFGMDDAEPLTLGQVGSRLNLTRERIRQIQEKAIFKLRHSIPVRDYRYLLDDPT